MLLFFFPLFLANVVAACLPVPKHPPWGRRCLLYLNLLAIFAAVVESFRPPTYNEWGIDGRPFLLIAAVLLAVSSLPVAWRSFHRSKNHCLPLVLPLLLSPATLLAQTQLSEAKDTNHWNHGNIIYQANEVLGRVALREGNREDTRQHLRAAGRTPGSPQVNSFGPQFTLARELLEHGERMMKKDDVARLLSVKPETLAKRADDERVPAHHAGRRLRFAWAKVRAWVVDGEAGGEQGRKAKGRGRRSEGQTI